MFKVQKNYIYFCAFALIFSIVLIIAEQWEAIGALWVVFVCLLPAMYLALLTSYLSIKILCAVTLITQIVTVPLFYLQSDRYAFGQHRPFGFTALEVAPALATVGLFLVMVVILVISSQNVIYKPIKFDELKCSLFPASNSKVKFIKVKERQLHLIAAILGLIAISLPIKFWMFSMGIGLVGVEPPSLPYRLSGIMTYLFGMIVPLTIGYFYLRTNRDSLLLVILILLYAVLVGLSSVSKSVILFIAAPIVGFAWIDRRWGIFAIAGLIAGLGVLIAESSRAIVYVQLDSSIGAETGLGTLRLLQDVLRKVEWTPENFLVYTGIVARIQGFEKLFLSSQFNAEMVGGPFRIFLKAVSGYLVPMDHDTLHIEFLGRTTLPGFYDAGTTIIDWMLMSSNNNILMLLPFAIYTAFTLVFLEKLLMIGFRKYRFQMQFIQTAMLFIVLWFYAATGSIQFHFIVLLVVIFGFLPAVRLKI